MKIATCLASKNGIIPTASGVVDRQHGSSWESCLNVKCFISTTDCHYGTQSLGKSLDVGTGHSFTLPTWRQAQTNGYPRRRTSQPGYVRRLLAPEQVAN